MTTRTITSYEVMVHGVVNLDRVGGLCRESGRPIAAQEHCGDDNPDVYNVWLRRNYNTNDLEPFDSDPDFDADFENQRGALLYAQVLAALFNTDVEVY